MTTPKPIIGTGFHALGGISALCRTNIPLILKGSAVEHFQVKKSI
jgi:hypothetical protein